VLDRPATLAALYAAALTGHELGDYVAQTNDQACRKAAPGYNLKDETTYWRTWLANQAHCATYHATLAATVALAARATGIRLSPRHAAAGLALSWVSHAIIDRRWPVKKIMKWTGSKDWYPAGAPHVDQALHKGFLFAAALIAVGGTNDLEEQA
jgi:hypothetical protein